MAIHNKKTESKKWRNNGVKIISYRSDAHTQKTTFNRIIQYYIVSNKNSNFSSLKLCQGRHTTTLKLNLFLEN